MSLIFKLDGVYVPLVSPTYFPTDGPMEIDSFSVAGSDDRDIQLIACYREQPVIPKNSETGRQMTVDTTQCHDDGVSSLWQDEEFIDQYMQAECGYPNMGAGPEDRYNANVYEISQCARLPPVPD